MDTRPDAASRSAAFDCLGARFPVAAALGSRHPIGLFLAQSTVLLLAYLALMSFLERATSLPQSSYFEPILTVQLLWRVGPLLGIAVLAGAIALSVFGALLAPWHALQHGGALRKLTLALSVLISWPFITMGFNHYFDQGYLPDRAILALLVPLIWWRPAFLLAFLPVVYILMGQIAQPDVGGTVLAHKLQVIHALGIVAAAVLVHACSGQRSTQPVVFVLACFVAAQYWLPALAKLQLDWLGNNQLYLAPLAGYTSGWLAFLTPEQIVEFTQALQPLNPVLKWFTIAVEAGCVFLLWKRPFSLALLAAVIAFHVGVLMLYGLFFWTWIGLDVALLFVLWREDRWPDLHRPFPFAASLVLILAAPLWAGAPQLGWYETPLFYTYRFDVVDADGHVETLHPDFFAPYEAVFGFASFGYTSTDHGVPVATHGVTRDTNLIRALQAAVTPAQILELEGAPSRYDSERADRLFGLVRDYIGNRNRNGDRLAWLQRLRPPPQIVSHAPGLRKLGGAQLHAVTIVELTWFYDGETLSRIRELELTQIEIPTRADASELPGGGLPNSAERDDIEIRFKSGSADERASRIPK